MYKKIIVTIFLMFLTISSSGDDHQLASSSKELTVPKFLCEMPQYRPSGDGTNQVRQLQKIESKYRSCIQDFKVELKKSRSSLKEMQQESQGDDQKLTDIAAALALIDGILIRLPKSNTTFSGPDAHQRDFVDRVHTGT